MDINTIRKTILELKSAGYELDTIEAFLIHTDDWVDIVKASQYGNINLQDSGGEVSICGTKIIENHHLPRGTIFKVFKDGGLLSPVPQWLPNEIAVSGVVSNGLGPKDFKFPDFILEDACVDDVEKKVEKRHSTTRKIELD